MDGDRSPSVLSEPTTEQRARSIEQVRPARDAAPRRRRRIRFALVHSPDDGRWQRVRRLAAKVARELRPKPLLQRLKRKLRQWQGQLRRVAEAHAAQRVIEASRQRACGYDVVCLPVMPWKSRVQRPQQLMRRFAEHGHRVFYASMGFHAGAAAEVEEVAPAVFGTTLPGTPGTNIYEQLPTAADVERMVAALDRLRLDHRVTSAVVVVQLPFWTALAEELRKRFGWPFVYECMDDHTNFSTNGQTMFGAEQRTIAEADLVVVTSDVLQEKARPKARRMVLIRNACEYEHFADECRRRLRSPMVGRGQGNAELANRRLESPTTPVTLGFFGAVADWFDSDLVADLAESRPDWKFELIGSTLTGDVSRLRKLGNVKLLGEQPYADLPRLMAHWDCHLIPFRRIPLTDAMNPVKAYEILATGKPLVATNLPELRSMAREGLLTLADDARGFAEAVERSLADDDPRRRQQRLDFAAANTWDKRWEDFDAAVREVFPLASILTATYNNLPLNKAWLHSILTETDYPNFEIVVVDNALDRRHSGVVDRASPRRVCKSSATARTAASRRPTTRPCALLAASSSAC